jgi:hypothetical protein
MNLVICNETLEPSPEGGPGFISPTGKLNDPGVEWGRSGWPNDGGKVPESADLLQPPNVSDPVRIKNSELKGDTFPLPRAELVVPLERESILAMTVPHQSGNYRPLAPRSHFTTSRF